MNHSQHPNIHLYFATAGRYNVNLCLKMYTDNQASPRNGMPQTPYQALQQGYGSSVGSNYDGYGNTYSISEASSVSPWSQTSSDDSYYPPSRYSHGDLSSYGTPFDVSSISGYSSPQVSYRRYYNGSDNTSNASGCTNWTKLTPNSSFSSDCSRFEPARNQSGSYPATSTPTPTKGFSWNPRDCAII